MTRQTPQFIPLPDFIVRNPDDMQQRAADFCEQLRKRRTVRDFSPSPVPRSVIENCILAAGSAPNGANLQPWHFAVVESAALKQKIRAAAEIEEHEFYHGKAPAEWIDALSHLGTNESKPFLETAPYLIAVFAQNHGVGSDGQRIKHYYVQQSVGIALGFLIAALHHAGLATLTHTPSPMNFLNELLGRPENEKPYVLLVVGYPTTDAKVPEISKKTLGEIATFL